MKFILGEKIAMTQIWQGEERKVVTRLKVGPCVVLQLKTKDKDGYEAVQIGYGEKKPKNLTKSLKGHFKNLGNFRYVREFRLDKMDKKIVDLKIGDVIDLTTFAGGESVKLIGTSKGKGFAGVVKRHGFHGQSATHGTKDQVRMPGSIGAGGVQRVFKGKRMGGRMGGDQVTLPSVNILEVNEEANEILIEGGVPGVRGSLIEIYSKGEMKVSTPAEKVEAIDVPVLSEVEGAEVVTEEVKNEEPIVDVPVLSEVEGEEVIEGSNEEEKTETAVVEDSGVSKE